MPRKPTGAARPVIASVRPAPTLPEQSKPPAPEPAAPLDRVTDLRVSAHLMTLESGLYCLFPSPGSTPPDPVTGLPGIRITSAPTRPGRPDAVTISTFREDGWLDSTAAALVRVSNGAGQLLITIYQHALQKPEAAPRVEVLRLSSQPNAASSTPNRQISPPPASEAPAQPKPEVMAHIQRRGDVGGAIGEWMGNKGSQQWIEGFGIAPANGIALEDVEYQAVLGRDWLSPWVQGGKYCGSRGMALPLLGLKLRLKGAAAKAFECTYSATFVDGTTVGPIAADETCIAQSLAALEAFQIVFKAIAAKAASAKRAVPKRTVPGPVAASSKRVGRR